MRSYVAHWPPELDSADIGSAEAMDGFDVDTVDLFLTFTPDGTEHLNRFTDTHMGNRFLLMLDGRVHAAPLVQGTIPNGRLRICLDPGTSRSDAAALANRIQVEVQTR